MTFTADSPIAARVVASPASEIGQRAGGTADIRAITIHMAEGGGTVSWLTRPDGNSSHYVVEYTGRVTQMVPEAYWAGSMNPDLTRTTDDAPFEYLGETITYGVTASKRCLGDGWRDPNRFVIAIEVEGFAKDGPNDLQRTALRRLVADIRSRRGPLPCLGHRDQQAYKACPGKRIPWADYGGHAVIPSEGDPMIRYFDRLYDLPDGTPLHVSPGAPRAAVTSSAKPATLCVGVPLKPGGEQDDAWRAVVVATKAGDGIATEKIVFVPVEFCTNGREVPTSEPDPAVIEAARKEAAAAATSAERKRAQAIRDNAVTTLGGI